MRAAPAAIAALLLAAAACAGCGGSTDMVPAGREPVSGPAADAGVAEPFPDEAGDNQIEVTLFFLTADGEMLAPERRRIFKTAGVTDRARQAVQALLEGPEGPLMRSLPVDTQLHEMFVARDGTAFVDLGPEFRIALETGSSDAVFAVYAIVNTLGVSFEEIRRVKILIDGDEAETIGGHLDLSRPILPELSLVDPR